MRNALLLIDETILFQTASSAFVKQFATTASGRVIVSGYCSLPAANRRSACPVSPPQHRCPRAPLLDAQQPYPELRSFRTRPSVANAICGLARRNAFGRTACVSIYEPTDKATLICKPISERGRLADYAGHIPDDVDRHDLLVAIADFIKAAPGIPAGEAVFFRSARNCR